MALKFQSKWKRHFGDVISIKAIDSKLTCATLVVNRDVFHEEIWDGSNWKKTEFDGKVKKQLKKLNINNGFLVTVDYHT